MKKIIYATMLLLGLELVGCQKEPEPIKVAAVSLNASSLSLAEGETSMLSATISPSNADNQKVSWKSSDSDVATVNNGTVTAVKEGKATITVTTDDGGKTATCQVEVKSKTVAVESVALDKTTAELSEGEELTLTATVKPDNASNKNVEWSSSDEKVATVKDGKVTAVKAGTAKITVKTVDGSKTAECVITVASMEKVEFEDASFKAYCVENFDRNGDGEISMAEASLISDLCVDEKNISSLVGIECFNNLESLSCSGNRLTSLDISKNTELISLNCVGNQLTSLDVSKNIKLEGLYCGANQLSILDVKNNTALRDLNCGVNQLTSLDVSKNTALLTLNCADNPQLTSLDISKNKELMILDCGYCHLNAIDVTQNADLLILYCQDNQLRVLDLSNNVALDLLDCHNNIISFIYIWDGFKESEHSSWVKDELAVFAQKDCGYVVFEDNNFKAHCVENCDIDIDGDGEISIAEASLVKLLSIGSRNISSLAGIEYFVNLETLGISGNPLASLDVSKNTALVSLECQNNQLTSLDVSKNTALQSLQLYGNQLTSLDISNNTALIVLGCECNQLTSLDVSNNTALISLSCRENPNLKEIWLKTGQTFMFFYYDTDIATIKYK